LRTLAKIISLLTLLMFLGAGLASATTLDFAGVPGAVIQFDGSNRTFQFLPEPGTDFQITSPAGPSLGLPGDIAGTFLIGPISQAVPGYVEFAPVFGTGTLSIAADLPFSGSLKWLNIGQLGATGGLNLLASANLSSVNYLGANADLLPFLAGGVTTVTFQFSSVIPLTTLATGGGLISTSFSGSMAPVPLPPTALLLGSGLLGLVGFGLRRK
jgi:hypothetical protein